MCPRMCRWGWGCVPYARSSSSHGTAARCFFFRIELGLISRPAPPAGGMPANGAALAESQSLANSFPLES
jgi:hypothetical protein